MNLMIFSKTRGFYNCLGRYLKNLESWRNINRKETEKSLKKFVGKRLQALTLISRWSCGASNYDVENPKKTKKRLDELKCLNSALILTFDLKVASNRAHFKTVMLFSIKTNIFWGGGKNMMNVRSFIPYCLNVPNHFSARWPGKFPKNIRDFFCFHSFFLREKNLSAQHFTMNNEKYF